MQRSTEGAYIIPIFSDSREKLWKSIYCPLHIINYDLHMRLTFPYALFRMHWVTQKRLQWDDWMKMRNVSDCWQINGRIDGKKHRRSCRCVRGYGRFLEATMVTSCSSGTPFFLSLFYFGHPWKLKSNHMFKIYRLQQFFLLHSMIHEELSDTDIVRYWYDIKLCF